jgi:hypothetical protein
MLLAVYAVASFCVVTIANKFVALGICLVLKMGCRCMALLYFVVFGVFVKPRRDSESCNDKFQRETRNTQFRAALRCHINHELT